MLTTQFSALNTCNMMLRTPNKVSSGVWLRRSIAGIVVIFTICYLSACCLFIFGGADGVEPSEAAFALRGLHEDKLQKLPHTSRLLSEEEQHLLVRAQLGHGTWNMLHRMAAQYDKDPTRERADDMRTFFRLIGEFYPCEVCRTHFKEMLAVHPVDTTDNKRLSLWLCKVHNIVNKRLLKPQFDCTLEALGELYGSCGCFGNDSNSTAVTTPDPALLIGG